MAPVVASTHQDHCPDCGRSFPLLPLPTLDGVKLCPKCEVLAKLSLNSDAYKERLAFPQCNICGATFRNMTNSFCLAPNCVAYEQSVGLSDVQAAAIGEATATVARNARLAANIPEAHRTRATELQERMKLSSKGPLLASGTAHTTSSLRQAEDRNRLKKGGPGMVVAHWKYRRSDMVSRLDESLGLGVQSFTYDDSVTDVTQAMLDALNKEYAKSGKQPFAMSEVTLRFTPNKILLEGTASMKLSDFIRFYNKDGNADQWFKPPRWKAPNKLTPGTEIHFELFLHVGNYKRRIELEEEHHGQLKSVQKRPRSDSAFSESVVRARSMKRPSFPGGGLLTSQFRLTSVLQSARPVEETTRVTLKKIVCNIDPVSGVPSFVSTDTIDAYISKKPMAHGSMKVVFKLAIPDSGQENITPGAFAYVAKRFFKLEESTSGDDPLIAVEDAETLAPKAPEFGKPSFSPGEHNPYIQADCARLGLGAFFLGAFFKDCRQRKVSVDENIRFAHSFIAQEIGLDPSPASGMSSYEPFKETDQPVAGPHQPYHLWSKGTLVFADLQGISDVIGGRDGLILFDPMTHTEEGNSGVGDWGLEGIKSFLDGHQCRDICLRLELDVRFPLDTDSAEEDEGDDAENIRKKASRRSSRSSFRSGFSSLPGDESDTGAPEEDDKDSASSTSEDDSGNNEVPKKRELRKQKQ